MVRILVLMALVAAKAAAIQPAEILWDRWGTPHIFARDEESAYEAFGWTQARNHANVILRLYGEARGKAAEYWGEEGLETDQWVLSNAIPARSRRWMQRQTPEFRRLLDAFARGFNRYAAAQPEAIEPGMVQVLPVTAMDLIAHSHRVIHFHFVTRQARAAVTSRRFEQGGSNGVAIAPSRSSTGGALLLQNPHLPWDPMLRWFEAHLNYDLRRPCGEHPASLQWPRVDKGGDFRKPIAQGGGPLRC
jgi:acyl-homoserine-lactone acylase